MKIVAGEGKKSEILGGPAEGGPVSGGLAQGGQESPNQQQPQQHRQNGVEAKPIFSVAPKAGEERGSRRWAQRVGPRLPRFWVWVCVVWGSGLNVGFGVLGSLGFLG